MSKTNSAIHEINHIDELSNRDQWINNLHPLVKLVVTIFYIIMVVSFHKYDLNNLITMVIYPIIIFITADLSFLNSLRRLRVVLPLVCFVGIFNPFFDKKVLFTIGSLSVTSGFISMLTLMIKGILTVLASYLLIATTSIEKICYALKSLHLPNILITQVLLCYRYVTVLLKEVNTITEAYSLRAPNEKGIHFKVWGTLIGQLLLRSIDRANIIYESMCLRGYNGDFYFQSKSPNTVKDFIYLFICIVSFTILRYFPLTKIIGNLFI